MAPRDLRTSRRPRLTNPPPTRTHMGPAIVTIPTYAAPALPGEEDHPRKTQTASQPDATIAVPMRAETALNRGAIDPCSAMVPVYSMLAYCWRQAAGSNPMGSDRVDYPAERVPGAPPCVALLDRADRVYAPVPLVHRPPSGSLPH